MPRIELITEKTTALSPEQVAVFDWVVESRGSMIRPFQVLIHSPSIARPVAELGAQVRFESVLSDHDRELVIITAARIHGCGFEWDSHLGLARAAGVSETTISHLEGGLDGPGENDAMLIGFVRELCGTSTVSDATFEAARAHLGDKGVVELSTTVGYYTLLAFVMGAVGAC